MLVHFKYPFVKLQTKKEYIGKSDISLEIMLSASYYYEGLCYKYMGDIEQSKNYLSLAAQDGVADAQDSLNTLLK